MRPPAERSMMESRFVDVNGRRIHGVLSTLPADPEPPVVLVHGVGLSHRYLLPLAVQLAPEYHVYVPDLPGFGLSYKPERVLSIDELADWLADWIDTLKLDRPVVIGNSVGCQLIVALALRHPHSVSRAVLQGPTCDPEAPTFARQFWRWFRNRRKEDLSRLPTVTIRKPNGPGRYDYYEQHPATMEDYRECGADRLIKTFRSALEDPLREKLPRVACPTLVIRGAEDPIVPQRWAEEIVELLPDGRLIVLPGVSHAANLEAPLEFYRVCRPFLAAERQLRRARQGQPAAAC